MCVANVEDYSFLHLNTALLWRQIPAFDTYFTETEKHNFLNSAISGAFGGLQKTKLSLCASIIDYYFVQVVFFVQLGVGDTRRRSRPCLISQLTPKNVKSVVCGNYHTLAIAGDHSVWAWGWGIHGQLGVTSAENAKIPVNISILNDQQIIQVAAGYAHSAVLTMKVII